MHNYITNATNEYTKFTQYLEEFAKSDKPKKRKKDPQSDDEESEAAGAKTYNLNCLGGWPLEGRTKADGTMEYTKFGLPQLPVMLFFRPECTPDTSSFENWMATMGGPNGLPELVKAVLRCFFVQDEASPEGDESWDIFLKDNRPANSALVLEKYYSDTADPLSGLVMQGHLRWWWLGLTKEIARQRSTGLTPAMAYSSIKRYFETSLTQQKSDISSGAYRSTRMVQALQVKKQVVFLDYPLFQTTDH